MRVDTEEIPEIKYERVAKFRYRIKNFNPDSLRKSLWRAQKLAEQGPDGNAILHILVKRGIGVPPTFPGRGFQAISYGSIKEENLEFLDLYTPVEDPEEGCPECLVPLTALESIVVEYSIWEPMPAEV